MEKELQQQAMHSMNDSVIDYYFYNNPQCKKYRIEEVFPEGLLNTFRLYCKRRKIVTLDQLSAKDVKSYTLSRGVGQKKIDLLYARLNEILKSLMTGTEYIVKVDKDPALKEVSFSDKKEKNGNEKKPSDLISEVFSDSRFALFRKFCLRKNVFFVNEVDDILLEKFRNEPHVGNVRFQAVKEMLQEIGVFHEEAAYKKEEEELDESPEGILKIGRIYSDIKDKNVMEIASRYDIHLTIDKNLTFSEIIQKPIDAIAQLEQRKVLMDFFISLRSIKSSRELMDDLSQLLSIRDMNILNLKWKKGWTDEAIASALHISLKIFTGKLDKIIKKLLKLFKNANLHDLLVVISKHNQYITVINGDKIPNNSGLKFPKNNR
jgi:hypothetical protein